MLDFTNWLAIAVMLAYKNYSMDMCHFCKGAIVHKTLLVLTFFKFCLSTGAMAAWCIILDRKRWRRWKPEEAIASFPIQWAGLKSTLVAIRRKKQLHPPPSVPHLSLAWNGFTWSQSWLLCKKNSNCTLFYPISKEWADQWKYSFSRHRLITIACSSPFLSHLTVTGQGWHSSGWWKVNVSTVQPKS